MVAVTVQKDLELTDANYKALRKVMACSYCTFTWGSPSPVHRPFPRRKPALDRVYQFHQLSLRGELDHGHS
jgi:hypothetical protein